MTNKEIASILADKLYSRFVNSAHLKGGNALEGTAESLIEQALENERAKAKGLVEALEKVKQWADIEINGKKLNLGFIIAALAHYKESHD